MDIKQGFEMLRFLIFECETFDIGSKRPSYSALQLLGNELAASKNI